MLRMKLKQDSLDEDSQQPEHHQFGHKTSIFEVGDMSIEILTNESVKYLGQRQQKSRAGSGRLGDLPQIQTRVDIKKTTCSNIVYGFRHHSFSDYLLRSGNMGTKQRTRKNDSINATQDATTHYPD